MSSSSILPSSLRFQRQGHWLSNQRRLCGALASLTLDALVSLIDWRTVAVLLDPLYPASKGEPAWPPLAMFKALLLSIWYDLSDVKLAEALDDRASFRRFCGFSANEETPERTAFVRFRRLLARINLNDRFLKP
jgi:IS5 family transposase